MTAATNLKGESEVIFLFAFGLGFFWLLGIFLLLFFNLSISWSSGEKNHKSTQKLAYRIKPCKSYTFFF